MKGRSLNVRGGLLWLLAIVVFAGAASTAAGQGGEPRTFAIKGAKIVPVSSAPIENGTVVVSRGVIVAVGANATVPADAWVLDGKGWTVYPGLVDAFTEVGLGSAAPEEGAGGRGGGRPSGPAPAGPQAQNIARGPEDRPSTTPWRIAADEVNPGDSKIEAWREAGFTTVVAAPKAGLFPGQASVLDLAGERAGDLVVKRTVAVPVSFRAPGGFRSFPGSLMGGIAYVRQVWIDTKWDTQADAQYTKNPKGKERPRYDRSDAALAEALAQHDVVLLPGNTSLQMRRALRLGEEWNLSAVLYGGQMAYDMAPEIAEKKVPVLVDLKWPEAEKDSDPEKTPSLRELRFRDRAPSSPAALQKAGVKFAFYSGDIGSAKDLLPAVKKSIDAGLSEDAALRALTLSPAEIFGVADVTGSIEPGKIANLVVTDGDLFDKKTKVKVVFVDGKKFEIREPLRPSDAPKGDMTGKWKLSITGGPQGDEEATADLTMASDGTLSGQVVTSYGSGAVFGGWVSGEKFSFTINLIISGSPADVLFKGTLDGSSLKGTVDALEYHLELKGSKPEKPEKTEALLAGGAR